MTDLYLIAHKVRGEPALDIAIQMEVEADDGPWWIIPTSGHRAYPYRYWSLDDLYDGSDMDMPKPQTVLETAEIPDDIPDHYEADLDRTVILSHDVAEGEDLLAQLGLRRPKEPIRRRI